MRLEGGPEAWIQKSAALGSLHEAPLTHEIALATRDIRLPHSDPADRLLAATALIHGPDACHRRSQLGRFETDFHSVESLDPRG
jgi:PIN domain nuclease of toxin-antitoxin system